MFLNTITVVAGFVAQLAFAAPAASRFTFYNLPTPESGPCDAVAGPDGALWVQNILVNTIVRIDPASGSVKEYPIPYTTPALNNTALPGFNQTGGRTALACAIRSGRDGHLYAASGIRNQFLRINVTTKHIDVFTPTPYNPLGDLQPFNDITDGPTGMFFSQTTGNVVSLFDYKTEKFTNYQVPTPESAPLGMNFFKGHLYFAELLGNKIGRLNYTSGEIVEFPLPPSAFGPAVVRANFTNPDRVCFTGFLSGSNSCLFTDNGTFEVFPNTGIAAPLSFPAENTKDLRRNDTIYYSTASQNEINILNITSGAISKIAYPGTLVAEPISVPFGFNIMMNYGPGQAVFFAEVTQNRVVRYQL